MLCTNEVDGDLVWITGGPESKNPALVLEQASEGGYWVRLITHEGVMITQTKYDTLSAALEAFRDNLPSNA